MKQIKCLAGMMLVVLMAAPSGVLAATADHGLPGEYETYDVGARAAGMGGAMAGLADDVTAIFYNPAGLASQGPIQIGFQHVLLFEGTSFDFLGFCMPMADIGTLGLGMIYLNSGGFDVRDENFNPIGISNSVGQGSFYVSYARDLMTDLTAGVNIKVAYENIFGHSGTGVGMDLGGMYSIVPEFQVGLYLSNLLAPTVMSDTYAMGATLGLGGKFFNDAWLMDVDITQRFAGSQGIKWKAGTQVDVYENMAFARAGVDDEMRVSVGAGGKYQSFSLDYALGLEALGMSHKISAGYSFGGFELNIKASPQIFSPVGIKKTTTIAITATTKYPARDWELNVKDQNGDVIKSFSGEDNPPNQVVWNGKDDRRLPVPDGNFSLQLTVTDTNGKVIKSNIESVKIQSAVPLGGDEGGLELN